MKNEDALRLIKAFVKELLSDGVGFFPELLKIDMIRQRYCVERLENRKDRLMSLGDSHNSIENTVKHNIVGLHPANSSNRPFALLGPLLGCNEVSDIAQIKLLIIGPRSENELFLYTSYGFKEENIKCLDLISYSELITPGDMHDMPFTDECFDVVVCGWVIAYSKNHELAVKEIMRVAKPGALIAIGSDANRRNPAERQQYSSVVQHERGYCLDSTGPVSSSDILFLFKGLIEKVVFDNSTSALGRWANVIVKKKAS